MSERLHSPPGGPRIGVPRTGLLKSLAFFWFAWASVLVTCKDVAAGPLGDSLSQAQLDRPARLVPLQTGATDKEPAGVQLATASTNPLLKQGDVIVITLEVHDAAAGQKIRIQNSNHGANSFTTSFSAAVKTAVASVPGTTFTQITEQQMEIVLTAGSYRLPISQTVSDQIIPIGVDDASWAAGPQLQVDWLLSSAPANGAQVVGGHTIISKWITNADKGQAAPVTPRGGPSDAPWSLLRSIPSIGSGGTLTFEIDLTNYTLTSSTALKLTADGESTANDTDFAKTLSEAVSAAGGADVSYDARTGMLTFGPKAVFPFTFSMTAGVIKGNKDYVLRISDNQIGQIDVARAGVRLGTRSMRPTKPLLGVNEASGEFGVGAPFFKYAYPGKDRIDWAADQGFGIIRVPFLFQNVQAASGAVLNEGAMQQLDAVLIECAAKQLVCLLDMHNYGSYYQDNTATAQGLPGSINVSNARLAGLWAQIAKRYANNPFVWLGLMNEPHQQSALVWVKTANAIAAAVRATGAGNKIVFQGTAWDGAWHWTTSGNAVQMLKAYDPGGNFAFEAHQYLDGDGSGTSPNCVAGSGSRLAPFTAWLQKYGLHGIIGEIGWAANPGCTSEAVSLLESWRAATAATSDGGYIGLTYWANGPWWQDGYMYLAEPRPFPAGPEPVQLKTLKAYLPR
jgi:endoglucanase